MLEASGGCGELEPLLADGEGEGRPLFNDYKLGDYLYH
jgi:hypothetical protein